MNETQRRDAIMKALESVMPWETFANEVRAAHDFVVPTRFVPRKGKGELFEQTVYRYAGVNAQGKDIARKASSDKDIVMGNAVVSADEKSVIKVSEMLCLRLWHDPEAKKGQGAWYADPVYKADIPALKDGTYVPRIAKQNYGRKVWKAIPDSLLIQKPLEIYLGDLIRVGDKLGRYNGYNIAKANWSFVDALTKKEIAFPSVGMLSNELRPIVIRKSILDN